MCRYKVPKLSGRLLCGVASRGASCSHRRRGRPVSRDTSEPTGVRVGQELWVTQKRARAHLSSAVYSAVQRKTGAGKGDVAERRLDESLGKGIK